MLVVERRQITFEWFGGFSQRSRKISFGRKTLHRISNANYNIRNKTKLKFTQKNMKWTTKKNDKYATTKTIRNDQNENHNTFDSNDWMVECSKWKSKHRFEFSNQQIAYIFLQDILYRYNVWIFWIFFSNFSLILLMSFVHVFVNFQFNYGFTANFWNALGEHPF